MAIVRCFVRGPMRVLTAPHGVADLIMSEPYLHAALLDVGGSKDKQIHGEAWPSKSAALLQIQASAPVHVRISQANDPKPATVVDLVFSGERVFEWGPDKRISFMAAD